VAMLATNNLSLLFVEVSYFQIARSLAVVFQLFFTYTILGVSTSGRAIQACVIVVIGFLVGSGGELGFSWIGSIYGVISSIFVALNGIFVKKILPKVEDNEWKLLMYNLIMSIILLFPIMFAYGEWTTIQNYDFTDTMSQWILLTVTGFFGFLINIALFLQIKYTSPLTSVIVGASKSCFQTILSVLIFKNPISMMNVVGLILTISGTFMYSYVRYLEMKQQHSVKDQQQQQPPPPPTKEQQQQTEK